jgi:hypothetical protein
LNGSHTIPIVGALTNSWAPDGRNVDPALVLDTDSRTDLLSSFNELDPNGSWSLFIADLEPGDTSTLVSWGLELCGRYSDLPLITGQPQSLMVECSSNAVFTVGASGAQPLAYQWRLNGGDIPGATAFSYTLANAHPANIGGYSVVVSNSFGSLTSLVATLTVVDTIVPAIACPSNISVQCFADIPVPNAGSVTASDACATPVKTWVSDTYVTNGCVIVVTRTYKATDGASNMSTCAQTITVQDTIAPMITCPANGTVQCFGDVPAVNLAAVTATDNCGTPVNSFVRDTYATNGCIIVVTRTYRATDACGNTNDCAQTITVQDTTPPSITCPSAVTVQCDAGVPLSNFAGGTTSDNCDPSPVVTHVRDVAVGSCPKTITRTYRATDACGNTNDCTQTITVHDTTPPSIICPTNRIVGSDAGLCTASGVSLGTPIASDNCGVASVTNNAPAVYPFGDTFVTWTVIDGCGNTNACVQRVTVIDGATPVVTAAPQSRTNNVGTTATFSVTATSCGPITYQWYQGTNALAGETNTSLVLNNVQLTNAGAYTVKLSNGAGTSTSSVAVLTVNRPPTANNNGGATTQNRPFTISFAKLVANDTDPDGDALTVDSVTATSTNGGAVVISGSSVVYTPALNFTGIDRYSYTIRDGRGGFATAAVEIFVADGNLPSLNQASIRPNGQGGVIIRFAGIPGTTYSLQRAPSVSGPWGTIFTAVAPLHGIIEYQDVAPPPTAFYRTVSP